MHLILTAPLHMYCRERVRSRISASNKTKSNFKTLYERKNENRIILDISELSLNDPSSSSSITEIEYLSHASQKVNFKAEALVRKNTENYFRNAFHGIDENENQIINLIQHKESYYGSIIDLTKSLVLLIQPNDNNEHELIIKHSNDFMDDTPTNLFHNQHELLYTIPQQAQQTEAKQTHDSILSTRNVNSNEENVIDVMIVWTKAVECQNSFQLSNCTLTKQTFDNIMGRIQLAIFETNAAFVLSRIKTQLRLVYWYRADSSYTESTAFEALEHITFNTDLHNTAFSNRLKYGADIVSFWINVPECGTSWISGGNHADFMYSVVSLNCSTGYFGFGLEVIHNFGCLHDRGTELACQIHQDYYNFGYRDPNMSYRTIMSFQCQSGQCDLDDDGERSKTCTRIQRFSNVDTTFNGQPLGTHSENCARQVNDVRIQIGDFFQSKTDEELMLLRGEVVDDAFLKCSQRYEICNDSFVKCCHPMSRCFNGKCT